MRRALRAVLLGLAGIVVAAGILLAGLATPQGRAILAGLVERLASGGGLTVAIGTLSGWPPFAFGVDTIVLSDRQGTFAEIDGLAVDFDAAALLSGRLAFNAVTATRVAVERTPMLDASGGGGGGGMPPLSVDRFAVDRFALGAGLIGRPAALAAEGALVVRADGGIGASLEAHRLDGPLGTLSASAARPDGAAPLTVRLAVEEGADGILVGLAGRDRGPGYRLTAETGVDGDALEGTVALASDGNARFDGRFTLAPDGDGRRLTASGDGSLGDFVPAEFGPLLGGAIDLAVDAAWTGGGTGTVPEVSVREGRVSTAAVRATASGTIGGPDSDFALRLEVAAPDGARIAVPFADGIDLDGLVLDGRVAPADGVTRLDLMGRVAGLAASGVAVPGIGLSAAVEAAGDNPLAAASWPFALRLEADAVDLPGGRIAASDAAPLLVTADGTLAAASRTAELDAEARAAGATVRFAGSVSAETAEGRITADLPDLAPLSPLAGRPLAGALTGTAEGRLFGGDGPSLSVQATATDLDPGSAEAAKLLAGATTVAGTVAYEPGAGRLTLADLDIGGRAVSLSGDVALGAGDLSADLAGRIADLSVLAPATRGAAEFSAAVSGSVAEPTIEASVSVADGMLLDRSIEDASVRVTAAPAGDGWAGDLALGGSFAGRPLAGTARVTRATAGGALSVPELDLSVGENRITGALERLASGLLSGSLAVEAPEIGTLAALALVEATGSAEARVELAPEPSGQSLRATVQGRGIGVASVTVDRLDGNVTVEDAFGAPLVRGSAEGRGIAAATVRLDTASASAEVVGGETHFQAAARGPEIDLSGRGTLAGAADGQVLTVAELAGRAFGVPVDLDRPATVTLGPATRVAGVSLGLGGGRVTADGAVAPALDLTVAVDRVAASLADAFSPGLAAAGTISGRATVTGTTAAPRVAWQATWSGAGVAATRTAGLPGLAISASGAATTAATTLEAEATGAGATLRVSGRLPFSGAGLDLRLSGSAPLALVQLASQQELRLGGSARFDLAVRGSAARPAINGTVDLVAAEVADPTSGFGIAGAGGRITFNGMRATTSGITGRLTQGGEITVSGGVTIDPGAGIPADLTVRVRNGRYVDGTMVNAAFTADISVSGPLTRNGLVSGRIAVGRTEILLPDSFGSGGMIPVRHINTRPDYATPSQEAGTAEPQPQAAASGGGLRLDLDITSSNQIFVRGFGVDAQFGGGVRVTGTTGAPVAVGAFELIRGRIEVIGRRFELTTGRLTFAGDLVPVVDFAAETRTSGMTVHVLVTGPATAPTITFTSSPELPQEEVISHLLFGQDVGNLSLVQAAQLVDAVGQLSGAIPRGQGIFDRIRQVTGLDDLDIREGEEGGTTVGIGRQINENLRLGVEQDTKTGTRVTIDLAITPNIKARAEVSGSGREKIGITYEREY